MAGITSAGVGSGIDIESLVTKLVAAERAPAQNRITRQGSQADSDISALGSLKGALSALQDVITPLKTASAFQGRVVNSSDSSIVTASGTSTAPAGSYAVEVRALASAQKLASNAFVGGSTAVVGTGQLSFTANGTTFNVTIDSTNNTVAGIRDAINAATDNNSVQATIVQAVDGAHLVLAATQTGSAGAIKVTAAGGDGGLASLVYDPGNSTTLSEVAPAQNADVRFDGYPISSSTNTVADVIDGVTLTLASAKVGTTVNITVANNTGPASARIHAFVAAYNALAKVMTGLGSYDAATKSAGALLGDPTLRSIESALRNDLGRTVSGTSPPYNSLASLGIVTGQDGTLTIDETKLSKAVNANSDALGKLFGGTNGLATRVFADIDKVLATGGTIDSRTTALQAAKKSIAADQTRLDLRMAAVEARYRAQFSAMDTLLSKLQSTGNYLTQQFAVTTANK
jgi:flagellar hook-associated protein 2